jgi:hypothetical protein
MIKPSDVIHAWLTELGYSEGTGPKTFQHFNSGEVYIIRPPMGGTALLKQDRWDPSIWYAGLTADAKSDEEIAFHDPELFDKLRRRFGL